MQNNKIQLATRRNILDAFLITRITWYGKLEQTEFLSRLYNLSLLPSYDSRYKTAAEDIYKHTTLNNDWPDEWIFSDQRFNLLYTKDDFFLAFLCMTIHPTVRENREELITLLEIYSNNLKRDKFSIEQVDELVGKPIFEGKYLNFISLELPKHSVIEGAKFAVKKALVVGCSQYKFINPLVNPLNDANEMSNCLEKLGFQVESIIDPTQKQLKIKIDEFGQRLTANDIGLFYFAGHGVQVKGLNYLIPIDANIVAENLVEYDCVEADRILRHMENGNSAVNIVILDACRNNPFERSWGRGIGLRGLATMSAPKGSLIAYSTSPGKTASDGSGKNGLYTGCLIDHISSKNISATTMFQNIRKEVMQKSNQQQIPWESTCLTADFYFNK